MSTKICNDCGLKKSVDAFDKRKDRHNGLMSYCQVCRRNRQKKYNSKEAIRKQNTERSKLYFAANRDKQLAAAKLWRQQVKETFGVSYNTLRKRRDLQYKLRQNIRKRLWMSLSRNIRTPDLLGCSLEELKKHLEDQFQPGMNWSNYGMWEIDHIKPLSSFNLADVEELKAASHFKNLQPLWKSDNRRKADHVVEA